MGKIALLFAMIFMPAVSMAIVPEPVQPLAPVSKELKKQLIGTPVYLQIFKEERTLELYGKIGNEYRLLDSYRICNFSGGLGPKQRQGDFKSPEGFYTVTQRQLKPDSRFYRAINIGFPNEYDRQQGYDGKYLMIHGDCVSVGCYAMTNAYMDEIFTYVNAALRNGQSEISVSIYPFRMTESNMQRHRNSYFAAFWKQLQPGYAWFVEHRQPPNVSVNSGKYVLNGSPVMNDQSAPAGSLFALTKTK
ncbi:peptidoglycan meso-diaminopimelic acid protein amidase [Winslowiella iniecta]|uniref:Transpeptidase n=1 Tax=Winslowiella iniecta TaxID=1560201 RepID=A0A0L7T2F1_9GAMM|nr:peptidoglycan meso-diaminopimelic acid protein amidase [Winslowiella iniecta]KOC89592.1 transpeptidase [Winslowiella iniecta]KOC93854.1 transpeptidase [Winslowiella iniecta]